ncbi:MAG: TFIIB-type zinc finger domain-containing protein [Cyanobacteriota bacterium]|uniref:TFIIB-type zinc finger domain-containing protein n=1 Tax=Synechococcus sp. KORDI-100 TaxID=1280380 RepID=UPI0008FF82C4|nr:TFIIB-type zinc finger domain-containing protein [Synechococcus sp. KORDI-100]MEC8213650.1 TFIIB-type zinc finger domain-containing protein [Cyanobacteriota bacterium]MED5383569.1 TFIIB-type zinc finger domain-containing protein [Cyanobacteriota bacterium]
MSPAVCQNCGSRSFRADRSLGGRLICQTCGTPAGSRPARSARARPSRTDRHRRRLWLVLLAIVLVMVVVLSAL